MPGELRPSESKLPSQVGDNIDQDRGASHEIGIPTISNTKALSEGDEVIVLKTSAAASNEPDPEQPQAKKAQGRKGREGQVCQGQRQRQGGEGQVKSLVSDQIQARHWRRACSVVLA